MSDRSDRTTEAIMSSLRRIGAREARNGFADLLGQVYYGGEPVLVERAGKPMVVVVPVEQYAAYLFEREQRFRTLAELLTAAPPVDESEVDADIADAIVAVRAAKRDNPT